LSHFYARHDSCQRRVGSLGPSGGAFGARGILRWEDYHATPVGAHRRQHAAPKSRAASRCHPEPRTSAIHLVCAKSALAVPRVRAVADLIVAEIDRQSAP
jgi:hypothetical protein